MAKCPYFAHQVNMYDSEATKASSMPTLEKSAVRLIADYFYIPRYYSEETGFGVANPNEPNHQKGYTAWAADRKDLADQKHSGMKYFYEVVLPKLDSVVCMGYLDGRIGLGVAGEAQKQLQAGKPGFMIAATKPPTAAELDRFKRNHQSGLFVIRPFTTEEIEALLAFDMKQIKDESDPTRTKMPWEKLVIPHLETRLRTWLTYNVQPMRPYEEAHLVQMPLPEGFYPAK